MIKVKTTAIIIICLNFFGAFAQLDTVFYFNQKLTSKHGLSQSEVNCILQDKKGFVWFGTDDGLNRYNGYNFDIYKINKNDSLSISDNSVQCMLLDSAGRIWIGTSNGLNLYNYYTNSFIRYKSIPIDKNSLSHNDVRALACDKNNRIWIGTKGGGLCVFDFDTQNFKTYKANFKDENSISNNNIYAIYIDEEGYIWAGNDKGMDKFNPKTEKFVHYNKTLEAPYNIHSDFIRHIKQDNDGYLWIGSDDKGVIKFNKRNGYYKHEIHQDSKREIITDIEIAPDNTIWVGTRAGIFVYNNKLSNCFSIKKSNLENGLPSSNVSCITFDNTKSVWVGLKGEGVAVSFSNNKKFNHYFNKTSKHTELPSNIILGVIKDFSDKIWFGTFNGGLFVYDRSNNDITSFKIFEKSLIWNIIQAQNGNIWVTTLDKGIFYYHFENKKWEQLITEDNEIIPTSISLFEDSKYNIWISTIENGVYVYNPNTKKIKNYNKKDGLGSNKVFCINEGKEGMMWLGTGRAGITILNPVSGECKVISDNQKEKFDLSHSSVTCLMKDNADNMWIGTKNGLNKYDFNTKQFTFYTEEDGLASNYVNGIVQDNNGCIWISTNKGISKLVFISNMDSLYMVKNYNVKDGLQADEYNQNSYFMAKDGEVIFGGVNGLTTFYPNEIKDNPNKPPVYITGILLYGKPLELDTNIMEKKYIELDYRENFIEFEYVALNYLYPSKNRFKHYLEGLETNWSPARDKRQANYTKLEPGHYTFYVKASNNDMIWNDKPVSLHVYIRPPFWKTVWFKIAAILFSIIAVLTIIQWRINRIKKEKQLLEQKVAERTEELRIKNKNITDSIRYAKRIQQAIFLPEHEIKAKLPDSFVLFLPKDIVSGDFYWIDKVENNLIFAAADCTGHGVPGAFMSIVGNNLINEAIYNQKLLNPGLILNTINYSLTETIKQPENQDAVKDGMDIAFCNIDVNSLKMQYAGAFNPAYIIRNNELHEIKANRFPIGMYSDSKTRSFTNNEFQLQLNDTVYIFSDGYADQFGGPKGKKFMYKRFKKLLIDLQNYSMDNQKKQLYTTLKEWMGKTEQVDDILVIGIKITNDFFKL